MADHKYIGLPRLIQLLGGEKRRGANNEHICLCPAHADKDPSLYVSEGDKGIVMHCMSRGCKTEDICARIGIGMGELFFDAPTPRGRPRGSAPAQPAPAAARASAKDDKQAKTYASYAEAYGRLGKLVCVYPYTDSSGAVRFEVARIDAKDGSGKTFRQHRPVKPDGSGRCTFPIVLNVPAELRDSLIYRQPETERAVREGRTIYIVEGEKDVDTLWRLGLPATTNAGGGTSGKWKDGHAEHLRGAAEVVILPDNDETGEQHGEEVFRSVAKVVKKCYLVRLRDGHTGLKNKGDITDLCEDVGDARALEILQALTERERANLWQTAQRVYADIQGYAIDHGRTCQIVDGTAKMLCNFVALPIEIVETDDGLTVEKSLRIAGWNQYGQPLPTVLVPMAKFRTMDWALEKWDFSANIMPGNTVKDKLRWIMTEAGSRAATRKTIYSHCGWRQIGGKWVYLHQGGCIGADGITVDMGNDLSDYTLSGYPDGMSVNDAALASFELTVALPAHISVPLLGVTYLAPLCEFLDRALCPPSFVTALIGQQGTHKTSIASLFLNHFGRFGIRGMPANFTSTLNAVRRSAFAAKDALLLVDDYFPSTSIQERRKMESIMQVISRTFGDKANRARLNADLTMQKSMPARGVAMITGETMPDVGASGQARLYVIELDRSSYQYSDELDRIRREAEDGALRMAMSRYIEWLLPQADQLPEQLRALFQAYRKRAHEQIAGAATNDRADDAAAHIMIGLTMMMRWFEALGLMEEDAIAAQLEDWWDVVIGNVRAQGTAGKDESPVSMFLTAVREMLISEVLTTVNITPGVEIRTPQKGMCGYKDGRNYYFLPDQLYGAVVKFYSDQNRVYPLSKSALFKIMREDGIIEQWDRKAGRTTKQKIIMGKNARYLWLPMWRVDDTERPKDPGKQVEMQEIDLDEVPFAKGDDDAK